MADSTISHETTPPGPDNPINQPDPSLPPPPSSSSTPPTTAAAVNPPNLNPNPNPYPYTTTPPPPHFLSPPSIQPYPPLQVGAVPPPAPSFRPPTTPQFSPIPNSNFQHNFRNPGVPVQVQVQPPGVSSSPMVMPPAPASGGSVTVPSMPAMMSYGQLPNPAMRPYAPMPNGYPTIPGQAPPGILRYPPMYASMVRPGFPQRPLGTVGFVPALSRPPIPGIRGPIIIPPVVRPAVLPVVMPTEKPQPTVYVNKISSTVENEFMLSLLQLCGPVKSWKRPQDPTTGALKGFGICEFDSAEGVLRALRLLSKLSVDGQELMLKVSQATREYLERYIADKKKVANKEEQTEGSEKEEANASSAGDKKDEADDSKGKDNEDKDADKNKEIKDIGSFGLVTDEDKEADQDTSDKLKNMLEERLKSKPLPPPPPPPLPQAVADATGGDTNSELPAKSRDGGDQDMEIRHDGRDDRNDDETTSGSKPASEPNKGETETSPDRNRRNDRRSRDRERDLKRDKERELERLERDREQERAKRERDREYKNREDERRFRARLKEWESREREREHTRKLEREREKEREQERKWEISDQEREIEESYSKKRKYKSSAEDRKRRLREKEEDLADRLKEEVEIAEAKKRAEEEREQQHKQAETTFKILSASAVTNGSNSKSDLPDETNIEMRDAEADDHTSDLDSEHEHHIGGHDIHQNGTGEESTIGATGTSDTRHSNVPTRKLGFGLVGSGKRTAVPSVFHEEEDEDAQKDKKMRPLVPIDYSAEELQAVHDSAGGAPSPNLAAAAEFAKRIANVNPKEDRPDAEKDRGSRRTHERYSSHHRDREDNADKGERGLDKAKTQENRKLLDAKQLIDTIPKTKEELFSYEINWVTYDKNDLHEKMRPWISKKITEYLGEEEPTLVDYIVQSTREHTKAPGMLERLQSILDDEAEMFVLKMWRMLIFEIKRVETGLVSRSSTSKA